MPGTTDGRKGGRPHGQMFEEVDAGPLNDHMRACAECRRNAPRHPRGLCPEGKRLFERMMEDCDVR